MFRNSAVHCAALFALLAALGPSQESAADEQNCPLPVVSSGGEWNPAGREVAPTAYRGCLVNRTYSPATVVIVRAGGATVFHLPAGGHYRTWLFHGEAVFVAANPVTGKITAYEKHEVVGETTVSVGPSTLTFKPGVDECLKHPKAPEPQEK